MENHRNLLHDSWVAYELFFQRMVMPVGTAHVLTMEFAWVTNLATSYVFALWVIMADYVKQVNYPFLLPWLQSRAYHDFFAGRNIGFQIAQSI